MEAQILSIWVAKTNQNQYLVMKNTKEHTEKTTHD
ncbi:uncharacterized protein G2W53_016449 [Senna tora]|uniref:Uncharacterized protein n=1 Tax=Senna tora TaxID=362788 RepID=A0A834TNW6_9FABA|nr:uncharacterized protein G2W53_016449 [Senna tora]